MSEVAYLRKCIELEYIAGRRALTELSCGTAQHAFISKRMENMDVYRQQLATLIGEQSAIEMVVEVIEQQSA